jgi:hypothetical protein
MCSQRFDPVIDEYVFCKLQARGEKLIVIKAIIDNHWQSAGNQSNLRNQKFSFFPLACTLLPLIWIESIQISKPFDKTLEQGRNTCQGSLSHPSPSRFMIRSSGFYIFMIPHCSNLPY